MRKTHDEDHEAVGDPKDALDAPAGMFPPRPDDAAPDELFATESPAQALPARRPASRRNESDGAGQR